MKTTVVGEGEAAAEVARTLPAEQNPSIWAGPRRDAEEPEGSSAPLARALEAFEADAIAGQPDRVVLADDSDSALAAALVATKLLIPLTAAAAATRRATANARLIAQLTESYTRSA